MDIDIFVYHILLVTQMGGTLPVLLTNRSDFHLDNFKEVAWSRKTVDIAPTAVRLMEDTRSSFEKLLESPEAPTIYGVNTGYGGRAKVQLNREQRAHQAQVPIEIWASSFGETLPKRTVRGIIFARLANYLEGHAAVRPQVAQAVANLLKEKELPPVPIEGHGCAGEILPLSHLFASIGKDLTLKEKEGLALVNGSPCASAFIADATLAAEGRLELASKVFALACDAIRAPWESYAQELEELWGDDCEAQALSEIRSQMQGGTPDRRPYQAPVSFRIVPRVLGGGYRAFKEGKHTANLSLRSITDNPVYIPPSKNHPLGQVLSNGGFHNVQVAEALVSYCSVWANMCLICERQTSRLLDPEASRTEIKQRTLSGEGFIDYLGMAQAGILEQTRQWNSITLLPGSESGGFDQNDVATSELWAYKKEQQLGKCLLQAMAVLSAVCSQIYFSEDRAPAPKLQEFLDFVRSHFPPVDQVRPLGVDIERLSEAYSKEVFVDPSLRKQGFPSR